MAGFVALLRAINVGGRNKLPMADLRGIAEGLGWTGVRSYVASGNLVFHASGGVDALAGALREAIADAAGLNIATQVLTAAAFRQAANGCPFDPEDARVVHGFFLEGKPVPQMAKIEALKLDGDEVEIGERVAWLHTPGGVGRSKLAAGFERLLGVGATGCNLRTIRAVAEMLDEGIGG